MYVTDEFHNKIAPRRFTFNHFNLGINKNSTKSINRLIVEAV